MNRGLIVATLLAALIAFSFVGGLATAQGGLTDPHPVYGYVYDTDGETVLPDATVVIKNLETGDEETVTTASNGTYIVDLGNFEHGYSDGDSIKVTATLAGESGSTTSTVVVPGGERVDVTLGVLAEAKPLNLLYIGLAIVFIVVVVIVIVVKSRG